VPVEASRKTYWTATMPGPLEKVSLTVDQPGDGA
jgi:hypothetical protein